MDMAQRNRVLVVDDDPSVRAVLRRVLQRHGWETIDAAGPGGAIETVRLAEPPFTVAIVDVVLAGGESGILLAEQLLRIDARLRFLFISGHLDLDVMAARIPRQAMAFLGKPLSVTRVIEEVERLGVHPGTSKDV